MKNKIIFTLFTLVVFLGVGFYISSKVFSLFPKDRPLGKSEENIGNVTSAKTKELSLDTAGVEQNAKPNIPPPNLNRPVNITGDLSDAAKKMATEKIVEMSSALKKDPSLFDTWLILGIHRKTIGDYEGAREIWEYAAALRPGNYIPFNNLGDLYAFFLKDNKKAEENFLKALENDPAYIYIYRSAYDFYLYVLKDEAKAKALLQKGIAANPGAASQGLQELLQNY